MTEHTSKGVHPDCESRGSHHHKSKIGVSVVPQKDQRYCAIKDHDDFVSFKYATGAVACFLISTLVV